MDAPEILFEQRGQLGLITLNRPEALNALTYGMIRALDAQLDIWAADDGVSVVAIQGAGDKAFAAGGDIRALYDAGQGGRTGEANFRFFADEYRLNVKIKTYPKPYVSIMDGIVMGGGVGVSIHGSHRFITERTVFAMPETGIGLFPDVGATYFLSRMGKNLAGAGDAAFGLFCGLTGARLKGEAARVLLDTQAILAVDIDKLLDWLAAGRRPDEIAGFSCDQQVPLELGSTDDWLANTVDHLGAVADVNDSFLQPDVESVLATLESAGTDWAAKQRKIILSKSPTSTRIAFRQIREGARLSFEDCMRLEYRLARYCMTHPDFYEGVRAVILDKDNAPKWSPASLDDATEDVVAEAFADLGEDELVLG